MSKWDKDLFSCFSNCPFCILSCCTPCTAFAINAEKFKKNGIIYGVGHIYSCCIIGGIFREEIRRGYNIDGNFCSDCCVHLWCFPCAITQEYSQLKIEPNSMSIDRY